MALHLKSVKYVEGVVCDNCGMVYDKVTNRMNESCIECGSHLWSGDPNTRTYTVDYENATPCVCRVTKYAFGLFTTVQHQCDLTPHLTLLRSIL